MSGYIGITISLLIRYYTSIPLALQLKSLGYNLVGTIMPSRLGFPNDAETGIGWPFKTPPQSVPRGAYKCSKSTFVSDMVALSWVDSKPAYFLACGVENSATTIQRKSAHGYRNTYPCPSPVVDYNSNMGGVDTHGQLRMQHYATQGTMRFSKYYKSLFLGTSIQIFIRYLIVYG